MLNKETALYEIPILDFNPVGSLVFYTLQSARDYNLGIVPNTQGAIYWKDAKQGHKGPFKTLYSALEDYKQTVERRRGIKLNNVIEVDFTKRKRLR